MDAQGGGGEKSKKKKKPHRGYAFIVYEREKDMKGTVSSTLRSLLLCVVVLSIILSFVCPTYGKDISIA